MNNVKRIIAFRITRFTLAGAINTTTNFAILNFVYYGLHQNKITSIVIATSCAIAVSFILNRNFVFLDKERPMKKLAQFLVVSVIGVFIIQNSVYALGIVLLQHHEAGVVSAMHSITNIKLKDSFVDVNLSNIVASFVVMFWNYNGYRVFVFNGKRQGNEIIEDISTETA